MRRAPLASVRAAAACLALAAPALAALAQIQDADPRWVVVAEKDTPARCDDFERFYKVATFQPGQVLRLDGESDDWARVVYPASMHALVPAADARGAGQGRIRLAIDSRLRAPSAVLGIAGSWHSLYAEALPAGTTLEVVGEELGTNGEVVAYRVRPPSPPVASEPPHAYVKLAALRDATDAEIETHLASFEEGAESEADQIARDVTPTGAAAGASPPQARPGAPGGSERDYSTELLEPMVRPGQEAAVREPRAGEVTPERATPRDPEPDARRETDAAQDGAFDIVARVENTGERAPDSDLPAPVAEQATPPETGLPSEPASSPRLAPEPASIEDLEASLTAARKLDTEALDIALDELAAEFRRTLAAESAKPDADEGIIRGLEQRVAWLELRIDTRDQRRAIEAALRESGDRDREIAEGVRRWQAERSYVVVGRLAPSAVYDGRRLPLMYRVQSVDPVLGSRTIAYVRPAQNQDLAPHLGQIVGIVGQGADDDALRLRIVRPERVDELNSAFAAEPYSTE